MDGALGFLLLRGKVVTDWCAAHMVVKVVDAARAAVVDVVGREERPKA